MLNEMIDHQSDFARRKKEHSELGENAAELIPREERLS